MASWLQDPVVPQRQAAPRGAWQDDPVVGPDGQPDYGIDFTAGHEGVRLALESLPPEQREPAMRQWAQTRMANPQGADAVLSAASSNSPGRSVMLSLGDEAGAGIDAGLNAISGGRIGAPYDEGLALRRAADERFSRDNPVLDTVGQVAGGFAVPGIGGGSTALRRVGSAVAGGAGFSAANQFGANEGGDGNLQQQFANRLDGVPEAAAIGGAAGGVLGGVAEGVRGVSRLAAAHGTPTRDALTKIVQSLPDQSVDGLADQLSRGASRSTVPDKLRRAFDIMGEEMVAAKGNATAGQANALKRIETELGVTPSTARGYIKEISDSHADGELFIGEYPSVAASDDATRSIRNLDEPTIDRLRSSEDTSAQTPYAYVARAGGTQGQQKLRTKFDERTARQKGPLRSWIKDATKGTSFEDLGQKLDDIEVKAGKAYDDLDALGDNGYDKNKIFHYLPRILERHLDEAASRGAEYAEKLREGVNKFYVDLPTGQKVAMPTLKILQDQRGALRALIEKVQPNAIAGTKAQPGHALLQNLYRDVTELMRDASPRWAKANDLYADKEIKQKLLDFGKNLTANPGDAQRAAFKYFDKVAPEAQDWMRIRVLQQIDDMITGKGDTHDLAKLFTNENWRKIVTKVFPRRRVEAYVGKGGQTKTRKVQDRTSENFVRLVRNMQVANRNKQRATGNSVTAEMLEMNKGMDADLNMIGAANTANVQSIREWLAQTLVNTLKAHRVRKMEPILTTQARDVPNAAMRVEQMRRQQQRINDARNAKRSDVPQRGGYAANVFADREDD